VLLITPFERRENFILIVQAQVRIHHQVRGNMLVLGEDIELPDQFLCFLSLTRASVSIGDRRESKPSNAGQIRVARVVAQ